MEKIEKMLYYALGFKIKQKDVGKFVHQDLAGLMQSERGCWVYFGEQVDIQLGQDVEDFLFGIDTSGIFDGFDWQ